MLAAAFSTPASLSVAVPASQLREVAACALQMWAYLAAYEMPNDDPELLRKRVRIRYPIAIDRVIGLGKIPTQRLQDLFARNGRIRWWEKALVWSHWAWFLVPHLAVGYVWLRRPEKLGAAAARMYATFDLGAGIYWALPTAPPWWAAANGYIGELDKTIEIDEYGHRADVTATPPPIRRLMLEYGEQFWGDRWHELYDLLGGNPLAAMPSLHFATSLMAARLLSEVDPVAGAAGWSYALTLGFALVYLGEHYVTDLAAGAALQETVHRSSLPLRPVVLALTRRLRWLRARAEAD